MYIPSYTREENRDVLFELVDAYPFATLITTTSPEPIVSHLPLLLNRESDEPCLSGHVARANPHAEALGQGLPTLAIFHGPHAYVSPAWYSTHPSVPTWNYAVVHVSGRPRALDGEATYPILRRLVEKFEAPRKDPWDARLPKEFVKEELGFIVGFELSIDTLVGKFKLNQSKPEVDKMGTITGLENEGDAASLELSAFTRRYFQRRGGA